MAGVSLNKAILIGNLGADPEKSYTRSGKPVSRFNIATTEMWRDKSGNIQKNTQWHKIVVWGKVAEACKEYLRKGRSVYIEGRIHTSKFEGRDGNKRTNTEIIAQRVRFLGKGQNVFPPPEDEMEDEVVEEL